MCIHTYIHTYMHAYIHTYIHTYIIIMEAISQPGESYAKKYMFWQKLARLPLAHVACPYIHTYIHTCTHTGLTTWPRDDTVAVLYSLPLSS